MSPIKYSSKDDPKKVYKHIYACSGRAKGNWIINKKINGKEECLGYFKDLVSAVHERNHLEKYDWDIELACEYPSKPAYFTEKDLPKFPKKRNSSARYFGFKGATWRNRNINPWRRVWSTQIWFNKQVKTIGCFEDPLSASLLNNILKNELKQAESC